MHLNDFAPGVRPKSAPVLRASQIRARGRHLADNAYADDYRAATKAGILPYCPHDEWDPASVCFRDQYLNRVREGWRRHFWVSFREPAIDQLVMEHPHYRFIADFLEADLAALGYSNMRWQVLKRLEPIFMIDGIWEESRLRSEFEGADIDDVELFSECLEDILESCTFEYGCCYHERFMASARRVAFEASWYKRAASERRLDFAQARAAFSLKQQYYSA